MKQKLLLSVLLAFASSIHAQWVHTSNTIDSIRTVVAGYPVVIAGGDNGVWRSANGASSWTHGSIGLTDTDVYAVEYSAQFVYAGTHGGFFISSDYGSTWKAENTGLTNTHINVLAVKMNTVFAGTANGLFHTYTNGSLWKPLDFGLPSNLGPVESIRVEGTLMYLCTANHGLFVSNSSGAYWADISDGLTDMHVTSMVAKGDNLFVGTNSDGIFISDNQGATWKPSNKGLPQNVNVRGLEVGGDYIFAVVNNSVYASNDDGENWKPFNEGITHFDVRAISGDGVTLFIANYGAGVWKRPVADGVLLGVDANQQNKKMVVYPNPCHATLNITAGQSLGAEKKIIIQDLQGRIILTDLFVSETHSVNLRNLEGGMYLYTIEKDGAHVANGRLVAE